MSERRGLSETSLESAFPARVLRIGVSWSRAVVSNGNGYEATPRIIRFESGTAHSHSDSSTRVRGTHPSGVAIWASNAIDGCCVPSWRMMRPQEVVASRAGPVGAMATTYAHPTVTI